MAGPDSDQPLVPARRDAAARIDAALQRAVDGTAQVVLVEGEAGLGKSLLLRHVVSHLDPGLQVLRATGEEAEQRFDYGVIEQLWAEARAIGLDEPHPFERGAPRPDPLDVGAALVESVGRATATSPLVVVLDDAQWFDRPSLQAIVFALRRLRTDPVLAVIATRPGGAPLEPLYRLCQDHGAHHLTLQPLGAADVQELARQRGTVLSERATARLQAHCGGNPLQTAMLLDELDPDTIAGGFGPLPAPRSFATVVLSRLAGCSTSVQRVVAAVAVLTQPEPIGTLARMLEVSSVAAEVDDAVARGLLSVDARRGGHVVDCAHPLIRSAVIDDLSFATRVELHARAATVAADPIRAMLHRLNALDHDNPELHAEALALADECLADGWDLSAAELMIASANVCTDGPGGSDTLLGAAEVLVQRGDVPGTSRLLADVPDEHRRARHMLVSGQLAFLQGQFATARDLLDAAWVAANDEGYTRVAAFTACSLGALAANDLDAARGLEWARTSLEIGTSDGVPVGAALTTLATTWAMHGDLDAGSAEISRWLDRTEALGPHDDAEVAFAMMSLWRGEHAATQAHARRVLDRRQVSSALTSATAGYVLADALYRAGDWTRALAISEQLAADLDDNDQLATAPMAHVVAAFVQAGRGEWAAAEHHLDLAAASAAGNPLSKLWWVVGRARLAAARGDAPEVVETLSPLAAMLDHVALPEGMQPWRADLVDALVACDRLDDAQAALAALDTRLHAGNAHAAAGAERARALLAAAAGDDALATATFEAALAEPAEASGAFMRARLELAAGAFHRRRGQRRIAAGLIDTARDRFAALGAVPFVERAEQERAADGLRPRRRSPGDGMLTPAEAAVAERVARGMSNREVAADLVVSVKTVESHLSRVFVKLGVPHRTALAARWPAESATP